MKRGARAVGFALATALAFQCVDPTSAAQPVEIKTPLPGDLVAAPFGYESISGNYAAAHATDLYISPYIWAGRVLGVEIPANQPIQVLAKVKDYDWLLVGKNGVPLGYIPLSAVSQVK
ncbi:MAG TPA: hypothetical protein VFW28_05320 [Micropepsaceae bacterium]|nr:hypothetical protein [Micropepsaceae bacterium]